jgi:hypothetical protein
VEISLTSQIFKEGRMYVAYSPEVHVSSCATAPEKARCNLAESGYCNSLVVAWSAMAPLELFQ